MCDELSGGVGLRSCEQHHADATRTGHDVLQPRRVDPVGLKPLAHPPLLLLGLDHMFSEGARQNRISGHTRCHAKLLERLHLDRMDVRQVFGELFLERVGHTGLLPEIAAVQAATAYG